VLKEILTACQIDRCVVGLEVGVGTPLTYTRYFKPSESVSLMESTGCKAVRIVTIPHRKSFANMLTGKAKYFKVDPASFKAVLEGASKIEKRIHRIKEHDITFFYTIIVLRKHVNTIEGR
jgi:hypothetical protein